MKIAILAGPLGLDTEHRRYVPAAQADRAHVDWVNGKANMGDWFVTRVTTEMLEPDEFITVAADAPEEAFRVINEECKLVVLKGGNFLFKGWPEKHLPYARLSRIKIPIVYIGGGLQAPTGSSKVDFTVEDIKSLRYIHDSAVSCMVRGESTAEALNAIGIKNGRVLGCPTLFWSRKPTIHIKPLALDHVGFTLRNTLFTESPEPRQAQFEALDWLRHKSYRCTVMLQGEELSLQAYYLYREWGARFERQETPDPKLKLWRSKRKPLTLETLDRTVAERFGNSAGPELLEWVKKNMFFSLDVDAYARLGKSLDFVAGCRLHGNIAALANGTPAFYYVYDERVREIIDLYDIPHKDLRLGDPTIDFDKLDYAPFERKYATMYGEYKSFLAENSIPNNLP